MSKSFTVLIKLLLTLFNKKYFKVIHVEIHGYRLSLFIALTDIRSGWYLDIGDD